jgi:hypothetical protein
LEEYSTIAEGIDQELDRRGGTADIRDLTDTLVAKFDLRKASVKFYLNAPMFVIEGDTVRRRRSTDAHAPVPPIADTAGCYLVGPDALAWRVEASGDMILGSGRPLPAAVAGWLGVTPGGRRSLNADGGRVGVTWPESSANGPCLGSVRSLLVRAGGRAGEEVLLAFGREEGSIAMTRIDPTAVNATRGLQRLSLLTGIQQGDGEGTFFHALGQALGVQGTPTAVRAALNGRGECALAELVPAEDESSQSHPASGAQQELF